VPDARRKFIAENGGKVKKGHDPATKRMLGDYQRLIRFEAIDAMMAARAG
jgi:hypothetical protein